MTDNFTETRLRKRYRAEKRFKIYSVSALILALLILATLISSIAISSIPAFTQINIGIDVKMNDDQILQFEEDPENVSWRSLQKKSFYSMFPNVETRKDKKELNKLLSTGAYIEIKKFYLDNPNKLPLIERKTRWEIKSNHIFLLKQLEIHHHQLSSFLLNLHSNEAYQYINLKSLVDNKP